MRRTKRKGSELRRRSSRRTRKSLALVFALRFAPVARAARCDCVPYSNPPEISDEVSRQTNALALADVDHDGDLDVLAVSRADNTLLWSENDGSPADGGWVAHTMSTRGTDAESIAAADLDRDGDLDAIVGAVGGFQFAWFENDGTPGTGTWTLRTIATSGVAAPTFVAAGDFDRDGDL